MNKLNKNKTILYVVFVILILISLLIYNNRNKVTNNEKIQAENNIILLKDYNRFFTVNSCIYKYITYIQNKDIDSILKILNKEYVNNNSINYNNIFNYIETLNGMYSFKTKEIYYEELNDKYIKYYVYGELIQETLNGYNEIGDRYYILILDIDNQIFDITPFDNISYKEVTNG